jgi:hypothetical protein
MTLNDSPEYEALKMLQNGVRQQDLWKLLNNQLHGCVDPSLKMAIKDIKVTTRQESSCTINPFGIVNQSGGVFHELVFPSDKPGEQPDKKAISPDWEFELSIFECFDHPVKISTSLEIDKSSGGLTFTFTPRRIERVVSNERLALVSHLREALKEHGNINVLEGENTGLTV